MKRNIKYNGLTERPHYVSIVDYLENEHPKTPYPFDRTATILRNSPYMTKLDGEIGVDLQDFESRLEKDKLREITLREQATATGLTFPEVKASSEVKEISKLIKVKKLSKKKSPKLKTKVKKYDISTDDEYIPDDEMGEMIDAAISNEDRRRESMPDLIAAEGLPDATIPEYLLRYGTYGMHERINLRKETPKALAAEDLLKYESFGMHKRINLREEIEELIGTKKTPTASGSMDPLPLTELHTQPKRRGRPPKPTIGNKEKDRSIKAMNTP